MARETIDFADTETALVTTRAMAVVFDEAVSNRDVQATRVMYGMLADATAGTRRLAKRLVGGLSGGSLGATFPPERWKDLSSEEIIRDLENLVAVQELVIEKKQARIPGSGSAEARRLSQEVARLSRQLRNNVRSAKAWIVKYWPDAWTDREETNFRGWL